MFNQEQIENIQIDHGIVYLNYGESDQRILGPTRGGATFEATQTIREIEFDGKKGKSKGMQVIDAIDAKLAFSQLALGIEDVQAAMPYLTKTGTDPDFKLECTVDSLGLIPNAAYHKNVTLFAKLVKGGYKKITLYNAMNEAPFSLAAVPNGEGAVALEVFGHWETVEDASNVGKLFTVEDVDAIS